MTNFFPMTYTPFTPPNTFQAIREVAVVSFDVVGAHGCDLADVRGAVGGALADGDHHNLDDEGNSDARRQGPSGMDSARFLGRNRGVWRRDQKSKYGFL